MRILITGGAGYIGSHLVPQLLKFRHTITVVDNFMYGQTSLFNYCCTPEFEVIRGDARDMRVMQPLLKACDVFIPLAAIVGAPACDADTHAAVETNYFAISHALPFLGREQLIVYPNTNSGYGSNGGVCTEDTPMQPISGYGSLKCAAESEIRDNHAGPSICFRLATVFGMSARMRLDLLVNDFVYRAVTDKCVTLFEGHFKRNYIHVRDVANAFSFAIDGRETMKGQVFNCGLSEANLSKRELCEKIQGHDPGFVFNESPIGEDKDKRDYIVSNAKLENLGWRPNFNLDDGIKELIMGYRMIRAKRYCNA